MLLLLLLNLLLITKVTCSSLQFSVLSVSPHAKDNMGRDILAGTSDQTFSMKVLEPRSSAHPAVILASTSKCCRLSAVRGGMVMAFREGNVIYRSHGSLRTPSRPASSGPSPLHSPRRTTAPAGAPQIVDSQGRPMERRVVRHTRLSNQSSRSCSIEASPSPPTFSLVSAEEIMEAKASGKRLISSEGSKPIIAPMRAQRIRSKSNASTPKKKIDESNGKLRSFRSNQEPISEQSFAPLKKTTSEPLKTSQKRHLSGRRRDRTTRDSSTESSKSELTASPKEGGSPRHLSSTSSSAISSTRVSPREIYAKAERQVNLSSEITIPLVQNDIVLVVVPVRTESIKEPEILEVYNSIGDIFDEVNFDELLRIGHYAIIKITENDADTIGMLRPRLRRRSKSLSSSPCTFSTIFVKSTAQ